MLKHPHPAPDNDEEEERGIRLPRGTMCIIVAGSSDIGLMTALTYRLSKQEMILIDHPKNTVDDLLALAPPVDISRLLDFKETKEAMSLLPSTANLFDIVKDTQDLQKKENQFQQNRHFNALQNFKVKNYSTKKPKR